jgi:hypothetical protein
LAPRREHVVPFFTFDPGVRKTPPTQPGRCTAALRKIIKPRGSFPSAARH